MTEPDARAMTEPDARSRLAVRPELAAETRDWLARFDAAHPGIARAPRRPGYRRGIDVYGSEPLLHVVVTVALRNFRQKHGRLPDPVALPTLSDCLFAQKFFGFFPVPNAADKLDARLYLPESFAGRIGVARRPWIGEAPVLPPDDAVPPGRYWLKLALGNATNLRIGWPPSPEERAAAEERARGWFAARYGVVWGEWWYGLGRQRLYLEEDLAPSRAGRPEYKIQVRRGRVALVVPVLHVDPAVGRNRHAYFDAELRRLPGRYAHYDPYEGPLAERLPDMLEAAAAIGQRFDLVRVDIFDLGDAPPVLNEITLGWMNARVVLNSPELDATLRRILFG